MNISTTIDCHVFVMRVVTCISQLLSLHVYRIRKNLFSEDQRVYMLRLKRTRQGLSYVHVSSYLMK